MSASTAANGEPHATPALTVAAICRPSGSAPAAAKAARTRSATAAGERARQDGDELLPADPTDDVADAHGFPHHGREQLQNAVAHRMTPVVVD
jgi:hypothetical protein